MARIRTIKPEFFTSESVCSVSPLARLLFIALWCEADREGLLQWKPKTYKIRYLPCDNADIDALADELIKQDMITLYEVDNVTYCEIDGFTRHQVINNREKESELPRVNHASPRVKAEGRKGKEGKEGKGKEHIYDEIFLKFWEVYPKKTAKLESEKVFLRQCKKFKADDIIEGAKKFALSCKGKDPQYIPYPATWLNGGRWADDYKPPKKQHSELPEDFGVADGEEVTLMEGF